MLTLISYQKWHIRVKIIINDDFNLDTLALFDTKAYLNYIKKGLIPTKYYEKNLD